MRTATNHYSLAFTYDCIAWSRDHPIDFAKFGGMGHDDEWLERNSILRVKF